MPWLETLRWLRTIGDTIFLVVALAYVWFFAGLWFGWSYEPAGEPQSDLEGEAQPA